MFVKYPDLSVLGYPSVGDKLNLISVNIKFVSVKKYDLIYMLSNIFGRGFPLFFSTAFTGVRIPNAIAISNNLPNTLTVFLHFISFSNLLTSSQLS